MVGPTRPPVETWKGTGLVLVIDDEQPVREVGGAMLAQAGFQVIDARNGQEGLSLAIAHCDSFRPSILWKRSILPLVSMRCEFCPCGRSALRSGQ